MSTIAVRLWTWRNTLGVYCREAAYQFWRLLRMPASALPTLAFPLPPPAHFFAKIVQSMLFALLIVMILSIMAAAGGSVALPRATWFELAGVLVIGTIPFCALGLAIGLFVNGQAAAAVINLIYLPMAFLSGLWVPIRFLPHFLQQFAAALPAYHIRQLALALVGQANDGAVYGRTSATWWSLPCSACSRQCAAGGGFRTDKALILCNGEPHAFASPGIQTRW